MAMGDALELLRAARRAALREAQRQIDAEHATAAALRAAVVPKLRHAVSAARAEGAVGRAVLFGSFAWGEPTEHSDLDLLVEGCVDGLRLSARLGRATDRDVHVIELEHAPESLVRRAHAEGIEL